MIKKFSYLKSAINQLDHSWHNFFITQYELLSKIDQQLQTIKQTIFPASANIFHAFNLTPLNQIKVVILGQDPYHGAGEAYGLAFATHAKKLPPSLKNIYQELATQFNNSSDKFKGEHLELWAQQGVLLLNNSLTVIKDQANSMNNIGWSEFTIRLISFLNHHHQHLIFILWGNAARNLSSLINPQLHLILSSAHPSPLSAYRGFFGNNHFILANKYLQLHTKKTINWI